jgi:hypothetical protein
VECRVPGAPFHPLSIRAPRQAGLRTSFRLAPSCYRTALRPTDREDARCDEPISAIQSNHVHPHLARSRLRSPLARRGHPAEAVAPRSEDRGTRRFTTPVTASAGRRTTHVLRTFRVSASMQSAWAFSSHGAVCDRASDTPVAILLAPPASFAFARAASWPRVPVFVRIGAGRKTEEPPRPPSFAPRDRSALETIRDAFHRQGLFAGSGGRYSPGPATTSPFWRWCRR